MRTAESFSSAQVNHLSALHARREEIKRRIREETKHPSASSLLIRQMKAENLRLKDIIEREREKA